MPSSPARDDLARRCLDCRLAGGPLGDLLAWVNIELTKSAAEIGYARFLHAARS